MASDNKNGCQGDLLDIVSYAKYLNEDLSHITIDDDMAVVLDILQHGGTITEAIAAANITIARVALWRVTNRLFDECITLLNTLAVDVLESDVIRSRAGNSDNLAMFSIKGHKPQYRDSYMPDGQRTATINITLTSPDGKPAIAADITPDLPERTNVREGGKKKEPAD